MKNILITTGIFPPDDGGPANYANTLFEELPKFGFGIDIVTYSASVEKEEKGVYRISREQNIIFRYIKYFLQAYKLAKKADIIFAQGTISEGLPTYLVCLFRKKDYYLKIVGDHAWEQGRQRFGVEESLDDFQEEINKRPQKFPWRLRVMRKIECLVAKKAKFIIVPSEYLKNIVLQWGIKSDKIKVVYNSVKEIKPVSISKIDLKNDLGLSGDVIISVGRMVPWKGFDLLIRLMPELMQINPEFKLLIIGSGPYKDELRKIVKQELLDDNVIFLDNMKQDKLFNYISASDMFVLNTGYEGLPHLLIEAMQLGIPVVSTKIGGNPEVIEHKKNGLLVEYNNKEELKKAIISIHEDKILRDDIIMNAKNIIKNKFSRERMINELISFFDYEDIKS